MESNISQDPTTHKKPRMWARP